MKKTDRITVISNMVVFAVIVGLKYLYRLEYQRGYLDGANNVKNKEYKDTVCYNEYSGPPDIDDRPYAFADALAKTRGMI